MVPARITALSVTGHSTTMTRLLVIALLLTVSASAQHVTVSPSADGITVVLSDMDRLVRRNPADPSRLALADAAADKAMQANAIGDVLRWTVVLPNVTDAPSIAITALQWKALDVPTSDTSRTRQHAWTSGAGLVDGVPVAILTIDPWKVVGGTVHVLKGARIELRFPEGKRLIRADAMRMPPYLPACANAGYRPAARHKPVDAQQRDVVPSSWLRPNGTYLKLHTRIDAPAMVSGRDVIAAAPTFRGIEANRLQVWLRGREIPLRIRKTGAGATFQDSTEVFFDGRRPYGDSTWLSTWDTTAVFVLGIADTIGTRRLADWPRQQASGTLPWIRMERHREFDTGHYHIGDGDNPDFGVFNSDVVDGEGFYWASLNASAYQRMKHTEVVTPFDDSMTVDVVYYTVNKTPFDPEHRFDASIDGAAPVSQISDGMAWRTLSVTTPASRAAVGPSVIKLFATGIDSLRSKPTYQSEGAVDHMVYRGRVHPIMDSGRLHGYVPPRTNASELVITGARSNEIVVSDRTNQRMLTALAEPERCVVVRGSITPAEIAWPTVQPGNNVWRAALMIDDDLAAWDTAAIYNVLIRTPDGSVVRESTADAQRFRQLLSQSAAKGSVTVIAAPFGVSDNGVASALNAAGFTNQLSTPWIGVIRVDDRGSVVATSSQVDGCVRLVETMPSTVGQRYRHRIVIPADTAEIMLDVVDALALQQPRVEQPTLRWYSSQPVAQADILYITHPEHLQQAQRLAAHRRDWNARTTAMYDIQAILDEYGAGSHSPFAVKAFLRDVYDRAPSPKPQYLVLVGNASWDVRLAIKGGNVGAKRADQIPTYGRPSSDYWYGLLDDETDVRFPELIVGRIPALTSQESRNHIDKIVHHDTVPFEPWMRTFFFIGGGTEPEGLCSIYETLLQDPFGTGYNLHGNPFCIDTVTLCSYPPRPNLGYVIRQQMNRGVEWMNFIGHGATDRFDIQGWDPNELDNAGRGGFMATYACQTGAFSNPSTACKNATYLTEPRNGLVATLGGTGWAWKYTIDALHYRFHDAMRSHGLRSVGDILYYGKTLFGVGAGQDGVNTAMQQTLLGDPLSRVRIDTVTDLYLRRQDVAVRDMLGTTQITDDDSVAIVSVTLRNAGVGTALPVIVRFRRAYESVVDSIDVLLEDGVCGQSMARCTLDVAGRVGEHRITIEIDPQSVIAGDPRPNNAVQFTMSVYANSLLPVEPQAYWNIPARGAVVRMLDPNAKRDDVLMDFVIARSRDTADTSVIIRSTADQVAVDWPLVDWSVAVELPQDESMWVGYRRWTREDRRIPEYTWLPVQTVGSLDRVEDGMVAATVQADRFAGVPASVVWDTSLAALTLRRTQIPVFMRSSGVPTANVLVEPVLEIVIGSLPYVRNPYNRGMNVVVLRDNDTVPRAIRRYDTWQWPLTREQAGHDGFTREFLAFLRDSVRDDEQVLIAICDEALTGFEKDTLVDSLRHVMRMYGSMAVDSLLPRASWVFVGRRGLAPGAAVELFKNFPDSMVTLAFMLPNVATEGVVASPYLGPAKSWQRLSVSGSGSSKDRSSVVWGRRDDGTEDMIATIPSDEDTWTPPDGLRDYPSIRITTTLTTDAVAGATIPTLRAVEAVYAPVDETFVTPTTVTVTPSPVLRGDTVHTAVVVRNAYRSFASDTVSGSFAMLPAGGSEASARMPWSTENTIPPNGSVTHTQRLPTTRAAASNVVRATVAITADRRELYAYNNMDTEILGVADDSTPPTVVAFVDGLPAYQNMYVVPEPTIDVVILDNSKLPISDSTRLTVFVNGDRIRPGNTSTFRFFPTADVAALSADTTARAGMQFSYRLESGPNNLIVRASDATGNNDTLELRLISADQTSIREVRLAPNPLVGEGAFVVELATDKPQIEGRIEIYDVRGLRIRTLRALLRIGRSVVAWDGTDDAGARLPVGVYHARFVADDGEEQSRSILQFIVLR